MRHELLKNEIVVSPALEKVLQAKIQKVEKRLKRHHPEAAHLEIRLKRLEKLDSFECTLSLKAFRDSLHAKKSAPELRAAIDRTFEAMLRELEHYRLKINKSLRPGS